MLPTPIPMATSFSLRCPWPRFVAPGVRLGASPMRLIPIPRFQVFRNALPPNPPNMTLTISDTYGFGDGNLAAGRMRVALFGSLERVTDVEESKKCRKAYLEGRIALD